MGWFNFIWVSDQPKSEQSKWPEKLNLRSGPLMKHWPVAFGFISTPQQCMFMLMRGGSYRSVRKDPKKLLLLLVKFVIYCSECVARRGVYSTHKHSNTQGEAISSMVGHVSTRITSKAIMNLIKNARGHSPIRYNSLPYPQCKNN